MSISTAKAAAVLGLAAGLAFAASGPASAFPKPKYSTTVQTGQAPQTSVAAAQLPAAAANPANAAPKAVATAAQPVAGAKSWSVYMVQKGDTLSGVGRRFGAPVKTLSDLNELDSKAPLKSGMKLKLPPGTVDSGKDPYAAGPSPFSLSGGAPARSAAASSAKAKPVKPVQADAQPAQASPPVQRPALVAAKPASSKPAATEATPARSVVAQRPAVQDAPPPRVAAAPKPAAAPVEAPLIDQAAQAGPADPAVAAGHGRFAWPVKGSVLSRFGPLGPGERNDGVNISADPGADVRAAASGEVVYAGSDVKGFGNVVLIKHADGWVTAYAHLGGIGVRIRDHVEQGQTIGTVGKSGGVDQPQLHFETRWSSTPREKHKPVDPLKLLP